MPTTKRRIQIMLDPETEKVISRLSELLEKPMSRVCTDLLVESLPVLSQLAEVLEKAKQKPSLDLDALSSFVEEGHKIIHQVDDEVRALKDKEKDL